MRASLNSAWQIFTNTVTNDFKPISTAAVYDTLGHKITGLFKLEKYNFKQSGIVDIVGNKIIICNYQDKTFSIFEAVLKEE